MRAEVRDATPRKSASRLACGIVAAAGAGLAVACSAAGAAQPNVVLIVLDTVRADRCSFLGYGRPTTPRLDRFARDAWVFSDAWAPASWTGPAHASLFTGLAPDRHGFHRTVPPRLADGAVTLAERLSDAGYATASFTNNDVVTAAFGLAQGFDVVDERFRDAARPYPWAPATHEAAAAWAEARANEGRPFFLFVNDMEPHAPYTPPEADAARFLRRRPSPGDASLSRSLGPEATLGFALGLAPLAPERLAVLSDLYDAEIAALDRAVGGFLDRLRAAGLLDSSVVVIAADHGESLGEHGVLGHTTGLHRGILRVPLLVRYPGTYDGGRRVDAVARLEDVAPTVLELCGLRVPEGLDGTPLRRAREGRAAFAMQSARDWPSQVAAERFPGADVSRLARGGRSVHDGRWHLVSWDDGSVELHDVVADPDETRDVAPLRAGETARLLEMLSARPRE